MSRKGGYATRLREKEKQRVLKLKLGNERGVMSFCMRTHNVWAASLDRESIEDKPLPKAPTPKDHKALPMRADWAPRGFGRKRKPIKWAGGIMA